MNKRKLTIVTVFISAIFLSPFPISYTYAAKIFVEDAETYREKGYDAQKVGDIDTAIEWYQKAALLESTYAAPHNDLGILFETKSLLDRAESEYKKALAIDPNYKEAHTNIALLYERKGELEKAAFHWMMRYRLGGLDEAWTQEAKNRLEKLGLIEKMDYKKKGGRVKDRSVTQLSDLKEQQEREVIKKKKIAVTKKPKDTISKAGPVKRKSYKKPVFKTKKKTPVNEEKQSSSKWTRLGSKDKAVEKKSEATKKATPKRKKPSKKTLEQELEASLKIAEERLKKERDRENRSSKSQNETDDQSMYKSRDSVYYNKAKDYYAKGEYSKALDTIRDAKKDFPDDSSLVSLEEDVKNKMKEEKIEDHYNEGMIKYHQKDFTGARQEFESIMSILPE